MVDERPTADDGGDTHHRDADQSPAAQPPQSASSAPIKAALRLSDEAFTAGLAAQKHLLRGLFTADATINDGTLELRSDSARTSCRMFN